jgi:hypothetical protein
MILLLAIFSMLSSLAVEVPELAQHEIVPSVD